MDFSEEFIKVLHLVSAETSADQAFTPKSEVEGKRLEVVRVVSIEDFEKRLKKERPDVVLLDHTSQFKLTSEVIEVLQNKEWEIPLILLIDTASENEALELLSKGVDEYVFLDRPARLPVCIRKIIKKYYFKREREQLEHKLEQNDRKFRSLIENGADGIVILNPDGCNSYISPSVKKILGYSEEEAKELNFYSLVHPKEQQIVEEAFRACFEMSGLPLTGLPIRVKSIWENYHWLEITFTNLLDDPAINGVVVNFRDISRYKKAELAIRENEEKYRSFFLHSMEGILLTVTDGQILAANPAACRMFDMTESEICRAGRFGIVDPDDERVARAVKERQDKGHVKAEITFMRKDGSKFPGEVTSSVFINASGEKRTSMIIRDLSEKKKAEDEKEAVLQELREKSSKLLTAQRIARLGYWEQHLEFGKLFWTEEVYRIWGRNQSNFTPTLEEVVKTVHPDDLKKFVSSNSAAMAGLRNLDLEHRIILPDGTIKWVHERGALSITEAGIRVFEGTVQDITEDKLNRQKLITSEARIRGILKSQTNYLIRVDLDGKYSYCNDKFCQDFDWIFEDRELIGKEAILSVKEASRPRIKEIFLKCISQPNSVFQVEIEKMESEGGEKYTYWDFVCLTDGEGNPIEIQGVGIDITDRVEVEQSLVESNKRYELVTKATSDAIYDWDIASGTILWSDSYNSLFGYPVNETPLTIDCWVSNVHPEDAPVVDDLHRVLKSEAVSWEAEYRYLKADGNYSHVLEKGTIIRNDEGEAVRMVGAVQDITDRKEAMQKLVRSEARHRGILQSQTSYVIRVDLEGNYSYCNEKFYQDFGWMYDDHKVIGKNSLDSIKEYHHERLMEATEKCLSNPGKAFQVELDKPGKDDTVKCTLWDMVFLVDSSGENGEIQCVGIDISDRVKAEKENRFQANLLDKIGQAAIATDANGKITYWNNAATEIYGWSREEVLGKNILRVTPARDTRQKGENIMQVLKQGKIWSGEFMVQRKDGTEFPALVTNSPFYDETGKLQGIIGISSDITDRKNADNKLLELNKNLRNYTSELVAANKGLEQFSYIVSHNLRAPVANILGLGELITTEDYPEELKKKLLQEVFSNIERLDSVITDLNDILQVKVDMSEKKEDIDLKELIKTISSGIDQVIKKEKVEIITDFSEVPEFNTTKSYLHSIFSNLIFNSIKYRRPGVNPVINIKSRKENSKIFIEFTDNGMGIDLGKKGKQIFGLYKRFHNHVEGKGMGLFMVKTQVEIMGGKINVYSEVNEGTRFVLEFKKEKTIVTREDEEKTAVSVG
ncbi:hypothetical protein GCM10010465_23480 [Actinomadura fibrosa]